MAIRGEMRGGQVIIGGKVVATVGTNARTKLENATGARDRKMANKGRGLEEDLVTTHEAYRRDKSAVLEKVPTEWVVLRDHDNPDPKKRTAIKRAFPRRKAVVDFMGTLAFSGRSLVMEAKEYGERFQLNLDPEKGWLHEIEFMRDNLAINAVGFFVLRQTTTGKARLVPGRSVVAWADAALRDGRKSKTIPEDVLQTYPVLRSSPLYPVDWLPVLVDLIERGEL